MLNKIDEVFDLILNNNPSESTLLLILNQFKSEGQTGEIIKHCLEAKKRVSDGVGLDLLLAEAYLEKGFIGLAEVEISQVISHIEKYTPAYRMMAEILIKRKRYEEATQFLETYLVHNRGDTEASELLKEIETTKGSQHKTENSNMQGETFPSELASPTIAEIFYEQGQLNEAISTYEKILLKRPEDEKAKERLEELRSIKLRDEKALSAEDLSGSDSKKRFVNILEGWILRIKEQGIEY